jgi:hypothetical protein
MSARPVQQRNITPSFAHTSMRLHHASMQNQQNPPTNPRSLIQGMSMGGTHTGHHNPYNPLHRTRHAPSSCYAPGTIHPDDQNFARHSSCLHYVMNPDPFDHSTHPMESRIFDAAAATAAAGAFTMAGMGARKYFDH